MWARIHLIPALQAEEDRDQVRRYLADKARERELLGSETRVYNSDRYVVDVAGRTDIRLTLWQVRSTDLCRHTGAHDEVDNCKLVELMYWWCVYKRRRTVGSGFGSCTVKMTMRDFESDFFPIPSGIVHIVRICRSKLGASQMTAQ
jgi:hypothetical protein